MNSPSARPTCRHRVPLGIFYGCNECREENVIIAKEIEPLVDEFWEHRGRRQLARLMIRAYRLGMDSEFAHHVSVHKPNEEVRDGER